MQNRTSRDVLTPASTPTVAASGGVRRVSSESLLQGQRQIVIQHAGREYRLQVTAQGKLILVA
jgi:hemin uptake protein HemP